MRQVAHPGADRRARLSPLVLGTMAAQALLVVLAPTIAAIAADLGVSVGVVGQARSLTAVVAVAGALALAPRVAAIGIPVLLRAGGAVAVAASLAVATAPSLAVFVAAHVLVGVAVAVLQSAGFAGVAIFDSGRRAWAMGYVAGANALAWILVNPLAGLLSDWLSWRAAHLAPLGLALAAVVSTVGWAPPRGARGPSLLAGVFGETSARRWVVSEAVAFASWAALLTFVGAYFVEVHDAGQAAVGWYLAAGAAAYFLTSSRIGPRLAGVPRRRMVALAAGATAVLLPAALALSPTTGIAVAMFCLLGMAAGLREPASGELGMAQLPATPGTMMAARTAATQSGYLVGAIVGGVVIAGAGYDELGLVLGLVMAVSALLVLRIDPGGR
jgi:predicted MFS family arabinose efflux permease